jgi:transcriptional regulator with XRE-family HTH domain
MARTKWTEDYFRKGLRAERERRGLTQPELAELFRANGINLHWSTIAKIENGDRSVRIDEAARIADVFEVSLDTLLGRAAAPGGKDELYTLRALVHTAGHTASLAENLESSLRDRIADVAAFNPAGWARVLVTGCEGACEALAAAQDTLRGTLSLEHNEEMRALAREQLREQLEAEAPGDETQS